MSSTYGVILLLAILTPFVGYLTAKLIGYGWVKGRWKAFQELYKRGEEHGDEERS